MSGIRLLARNSAANVAAGAANALLAVVLPPVLVRYLPAAEFSAWSIVLQLAAVVYVFQFGVQVAVGRYIAYYAARDDVHARREIASTAFAAMWASAAVALVVVAAMCLLLPQWFRGMPPDLEGPARASLFLIGASLALGLPASVVAGVYSGLQRNDVPAIYVVVSRVAVAIALVTLAAQGFGMLAMATAYAAIVGGASLAQLAMMRARYPEFSLDFSLVTGSAGRELASYCFSLSIWSAAMLVISGLDAVIAGHFDFRWAGLFGVAASAVALIVGLQSALLQPLIAIAAHLHSRTETRRLGVLLVDSTRISTLVFLVAIAPVFVAGEWVLRLWVGAAMAADALPIVRVLLIGVLIRQTLAPFATILLGTGEQRLMIWPPMYEAVAKLVASIALARWLGPIGVALGTVAGSLVCVAANALFTFPRVKGIAIDRATVFLRAILPPLLIFSPLLAIPLVPETYWSESTFAIRGVLTVAVAATTLWLAAGSLRRLRLVI